jgi:hypothetical protein
MLAGIRSRLTFANVISVVALFAALGLGTAWALEANSVKSKHIKDGQVKPADTSGLVEGNGKVLANRFFVQPEAQERTLFEIPGFGPLDAYCDEDSTSIHFTNSTNDAIDLWWDVRGSAEHHVVPPFGERGVQSSGGNAAVTVALGFGDDPGARKTAVVHVYTSHAGATGPCGFQAQATLWTNK